MSTAPAPKFLWLARHLPVPLNAGDRIYSARLAEALARAGSAVRFLCLANPEEPQLGPELLDSAVEWDIVPGRPRGTVRGMFSRRPMAGARFGTPAYEARLRSLLASERFDAVVVDHYGLGWTIPIVLANSVNRPAIVHLAHDFETDVTDQIARAYRGNQLRKVALRINATRTARAERAIAAASDLIVVLTEHDASEFRRIGATGAQLVVPPGYDGDRIPARTITSDTPRRLAIVGSYQWIAKQLNLSAFLKVADARLAAKGIELLVIGDAPEEYRRQWDGQLAATRFAGFVDSLTDELNACRMGLVIEAVGGGFKLKVLDYVMRRAPVAALAPALGGQSTAVTNHFLVRDNGEDLVDAICNVIDDCDRLNVMQEGAYRAASDRYDWNSNGSEMLEAIMAAKPRG